VEDINMGLQILLCRKRLAFGAGDSGALNCYSFNTDNLAVPDLYIWLSHNPPLIISYV
jgi:hypothetical protein